MYIVLHHAYTLQDWVSILEDDNDSDDSLGDWAKLETMRSSHPMDFAKQLAEVSICFSVIYCKELGFVCFLRGLESEV